VSTLRPRCRVASAARAGAGAVLALTRRGGPRNPMLRLATVLFSAGVLAACAGRDVDIRAAERVRVELDRRNAEVVVRYYLGGFAGADGGDPVAAGLLALDGGGLWMYPAALPAGARETLVDDGDGVLDDEEFTAWAGATYRDARALPATIEDLGQTWSASDTSWFSFDIEGSPMTHARRRLFAPVSAVREAIVRFAEEGELTYPPGTLLVGEHVVDGQVAETTVKRRRADGFWDFMVYDGAGRLAGATSAPPRGLRAPAQCTGCHLGSRLFEPDRSFPAPAPAGPAGPRAVVVPDAWRDAGAAAIFREHAARTDHVLGPYATVYVGRLRADRAAGRSLPREDIELLERLERR